MCGGGAKLLSSLSDSFLVRKRSSLPAYCDTAPPEKITPQSWSGGKPQAPNDSDSYIACQNAPNEVKQSKQTKLVKLD